MDKFDDNNNPVFSKSESLFIYLLLVGFGLTAALLTISICFIYFYPLLLGVKKLILAYPFLIVFIVFFVFYAALTLFHRFYKWVLS